MPCSSRISLFVRQLSVLVFPALLLLCWSSAIVVGEDAPLQVFLRHDASGPDSVVKSLQFSPDGGTLYVAGWNKVVQVYQWQETGTRFEYRPRLNFRVPIGPGRFGMLEAMVVSPDGRWLIAAGPGWFSQLSQASGFVWPRGAMGERAWAEVGAIYVFDTQTRVCRILRGHHGNVRQLTLVEGDGMQPARLVSLGFEYSGQTISQSVRVWALDSGEAIGEPLPLPNTNLPPRVRAWAASETSLQVAILIAQTSPGSGASELKLWSPLENNRVQIQATATQSFALELVGSGPDRQLFCGGLGKSTLQPTQPQSQRPPKLVTNPAATAVPFAATRMPLQRKRPNGSDFATAGIGVVQVQATPQGDLDYSLSVIEGNRALAAIPLWTNTRGTGQKSAPLREPSIAVSADGRFLAVAGAQTNDVRIYRLPQITADGGSRDVQPFQVLGARSQVPRWAEFVRSGNDLGIAVGLQDGVLPPVDRRHGQPVARGAVVLNAAGRVLATDVQGWQTSIADPGGPVCLVSEDRRAVSVSSGTPARQLTLRVPRGFRDPSAAEEVTAHACTAAAGENPSLVAVATHVQGEPMLSLFDASTGNFVRDLTGHVRRITGLSFSRDGELLLSASEDGTVRGWLVKDLGSATIGKVGWLRGVSVISRNKRLTVDALESDSPAVAAGLREGDLIAGFVAHGQLTQFADAAAFYLGVSQTIPGESSGIMLRVQLGDQLQDLKLTVEQGADVREPLFSMIVQQSSANAEGQADGWVVWSPQGQFDVSDTELEQRMGWHQNTQEDSAPVSFTSIDQYRDRFFQAGLLQKLLSRSHVALRPPIQPEFRVSLITADDQVVLPDYEDEIVLRRPGGNLVLEFGRGSGEAVAGATWQSEGAEPRQFDAIERDLWKSPITEDITAGGIRRVDIRIVTSDLPPVEYASTVFLRYQPDPPQLKLITPAQPISSVSDPRLLVRAAVTATGSAQITIVRESPESEPEQWEEIIHSSGEVQREIPLKPGRNTIRISAANTSDPVTRAAPAPDDQARLEIVADFVPPGPPSLRITGVLRSGDAQPVQLSDGSIGVDEAEVTITGEILGDQALQEAFLVRDGAQTVLSGFQADVARKFEFRESVRLVPGNNRLKFTSTAGGETGRLDLDLNFRPRLPHLALLSPAEGRMVRTAEAAEVAIDIQARIDLFDSSPFQYSAAVDGVPVVSWLTWDSAGGMLTGTLVVRPDPLQEHDLHRLEIGLRNEWDRELLRSILLEFLHPPRLRNAEVRRQDGSALADVVCVVESPGARGVSAMEAMVNGAPVSAAVFRTENVQPGLWQVTLSGVALREGENRIEVRAVNRDGRSPELVLTETVPPPPQKATVTLIQPLVNSVTATEEFALSFAVDSEPGLQRVDLVITRNDRLAQRIPLLSPDRTAAGAGRMVFEQLLSLIPGENRVLIEVRNLGGLTEREFTISYLPPPVAVHVTGLESQEDPGSVTTARTRGDHVEFSSALNSGQATLHGHIAWLPNQRPAGRQWTVRVWVNGFLRTVAVTPPGEEANRADFQIPVVLNQKQNRLRLEAVWDRNYHKMPTTDHAAAWLQNILVSCTNPDQGQRLHLIVMGVEMRDGRNVARAEEIRKFAAEALRLEAPESAFSTVEPYEPLIGDKAVGRRLRSVMHVVETKLRQRRTGTAVNDVVMFYYRGREHRRPDGDFVLEDFQNFENPAIHPQSVSEGDLARLFERLPGAHVVFLDVEQTARVPLAADAWPRYQNLGVFRVAWSGQQPVPQPPGPVFAAMKTATATRTATGTTTLAEVEFAIQEQKNHLPSENWLSISTFVPSDLVSLILAHSGSRPDEE